MTIDCSASDASKIHRLATDASRQTAQPVRQGGAADADDTIPLHLLRLVSASLPVGAFSYSRGLEWAVHAEWVKDHASARDWILGSLENNFAAVDGALFWRMIQALHAEDRSRFAYANAWLAACRESSEMQAEDRRMGEALIFLLKALDVPAAQAYAGFELTYPASFAIAAHHWQVAPFVALKGLMWAVVEAQVAAAIRVVPLGHVAGQRILIDAVAVVERSAASAITLDDSEIGNLSVAQAMASAWHETQYSRLFRS
ncbi:urease accessory UreF family protein [Rhizobium sp. R693]|uniref:urease accessory protein UreF n=1 Tax=Rhizobium sp. R693 TaxID=1764276 RepID=UPI000B53160F|nr:urease accessory UreF family protein [Rhizobium sp. R693]